MPKPIVVSSSEPASSTAANTPATAKASAEPTSISLTMSGASSAGSIGTACFSAAGTAISETASASTARMRIGTSREANTGARANMPPTRAKTSMKVAKCAPASTVRSTPSARRHLRDLAVQLDGEREQAVQHPRPHQDEHHADGEGLRDEAQRLLLDLRDRLDHRDQEADAHRHEQRRQGQLERDQDRLAGDRLQHGLTHVWKPATTLCVINAQPSTSTNRRILNGSEIRT